ncbi:hypothetical protein AAGR22_15065 [Erwinia sp. HDF1-3R]|uniref:hypothetical protein n=1 Tax=Erwinia sp. HDF1-3R TaxID=3141543 RepID=UPI0031F58F68
MIEHILARSELFFGLFASLLIFISFFLYLANKRRYENLVSLFKEKYTFPAPASFNHMVGFFWCFPHEQIFYQIEQETEDFFAQAKRPCL